MRVKDVAIGDWVQIASLGPGATPAERFHHETEATFMVVAIEKVDSRTVAVIECEDEHHFRVPPERLRPYVAEPVLCRWFLMCTNEATTTQDHPVLGDVPICERCKARANEE